MLRSRTYGELGGDKVSKLGKVSYVEVEGVMLTMSEKTDLRGKVESLINSDEISPYRLGKIESVVRGKFIPPQKIYGYVRQGYIKSHQNQLGKMAITKEEAIRYLMKTMANNA